MDDADEYEENRSQLFRELYENLPQKLSEEVSREMDEVRNRGGDPDDGLVKAVILSAIVTREVDRRFPPRPDLGWLAHNRVADLLARKGVKILNVGNKGYPDLLFEIGGHVFAAEVKGKGDCLKPHQLTVINALRRLKRIFVVRESGEKAHPDELSLDEFLFEIFK